MAKPIISWPGGRRRLLKHLYPDLPAYDCYVEVFASGDALLMIELDKVGLDYSTGGASVIGVAGFPDCAGSSPMKWVSGCACCCHQMDVFGLYSRRRL